MADDDVIIVEGQKLGSEFDLQAWQYMVDQIVLAQVVEDLQNGEGPLDAEGGLGGSSIFDPTAFQESLLDVAEVFEVEEFGGLENDDGEDIENAEIFLSEKLGEEYGASWLVEYNEDLDIFEAIIQLI